jgi:hypothetical protein
MGLGTRQAIAMLPHLELVFTLTTLELYEEYLLSSRAREGIACPGAAGFLPGSATCPDTELRRRSASVEKILRAVRLARVGLAQELSIYPDVVRAMEASLQPSTSREVQARRRAWYLQRTELQQAVLGRREIFPGTDSDISGTTAPIISDDSNHTTARPPHVHFVTYASEHGPGLQNLLLSAELAGIHIEVCYSHGIVCQPTLVHVCCVGKRFLLGPIRPVQRLDHF